MLRIKDKKRTIRAFPATTTMTVIIFLLLTIFIFPIGIFLALPICSFFRYFGFPLEMVKYMTVKKFQPVDRERFNEIVGILKAKNEYTDFNIIKINWDLYGVQFLHKNVLICLKFYFDQEGRLAYYMLSYNDPKEDFTFNSKGALKTTIRLRKAKSLLACATIIRELLKEALGAIEDVKLTDTIHAYTESGKSCSL